MWLVDEWIHLNVVEPNEVASVGSFAVRNSTAMLCFVESQLVEHGTALNLWVDVFFIFMVNSLILWFQHSLEDLNNAWTKICIFCYAFIPHRVMLTD